MNELQATGGDVLGIGGETDQYLTFMLADEEYGVDILRVQEIRGWTRATPIPNAPSYLKGVINLRGAIVPIIDLRERFGLPPLEYGPTTVVVVLKVLGASGSRTMGLVVDAVSDVYSFGPDARQSPPELGAVVDARFLQGLATVGDKMVILLDVDRLLNTGALAVAGLE